MKLKDIFKIDSVLTNKKTPIDIIDFLEEEYFTNSKNTFTTIGDMDLTHYIRSVNKNNREIDFNISLLNKLKRIKKILG